MMNRYTAQGAGEESEFEPRSRRRVLRNRLGITLPHEMQQAESEALLLAQSIAVEEFDAKQRFKAADICRLHRLWLGPIYSWAGKYRTLNISKAGFHFAHAPLIGGLMREFERQVLARHTPCRWSRASAIAEALAVVHAELVLIHPFRDGNGRVARLLAILMGLQAGLPPLDFSMLGGRHKRKYIAAIHACLGRDYRMLIRLFESAIGQTLWRHGVSNAP